MNKLIFVFILVLLLVIAFAYWQLGNERESDYKPSANKLVVVTSFYPLEDFTKHITGKEADVFSIVSVGAQPHDFEPTAGDVMKVLGADVFIFQGGGLDPWAERLSQDFHGKVLVHMFDLLDVDTSDPHVWLDPVLAGQQVEIIRDALVRADPANKEEYEKNANEYLHELDGLHDEYTAGLSSCRRKDIVVTHDAFGHLASRYGLEMVSISGLDPHEEPSARRLGEIARLVKDKGIEYIFFETLSSPRLAQTLAKETGVRTRILNPLEGLTQEEVDAGKDYISIMRENLQNLRLALECK